MQFEFKLPVQVLQAILQGINVLFDSYLYLFINKKLFVFIF